MRPRCARAKVATRGMPGALVAALLLVPAVAHADACPAATPALEAIDAEERLRFLGATFDREIRNVDVWSWTWGSIYAAAAVTQTAVIPVVSDHGVRTDLAVGAVSAGVGSLSLYLLPLQITLPLRNARRQWADPDRCRVLASAEETLATGARHEAFSNGVVPHIGNVLANAGIALILGLGYGRWKSAAISGGIGLAVGETNAFTQPHRLPTALQRYRAGQLENGPAAVAWSVAPLRVDGAWGAAIALTF
jgi:hypothetical protein